MAYLLFDLPSSWRDLGDGFANDLQRRRGARARVACTQLGCGY
ncbi:MAG TPA: hypothetical protein VN903_24945 [Polyangia bacterium]|jgi:hypothetical protein|nr:hypothetical protein [Polyangia bacterium]